MDDDAPNISTDMWKVLSQTTEQVWMAVNDVKRVEGILLQMQLPFIDNDDIVMKEVNQTWKDYHRQITWETQHEHRTTVTFELSRNTLEHSTLLHIMIVHRNVTNNPTYANELNKKCNEVTELLPGILFDPMNTIVSYESISIHCSLKELFDFVSLWDFAKVPHSLIKESKCIDKQSNEVNAIIQCMCRNGSIHYYQVAEVDYNPTLLMAKYNLTEIDLNDNKLTNMKPTNINIDSHHINFTFGRTDSNTFLSVEHQFNYKNIKLFFYQQAITNLIKDKRCMLIEIKKCLEARHYRKKSSNNNIKNKIV